MYVRSSENIEAHAIDLLKQIQTGELSRKPKRRWDADYFAGLDRDDRKVIIPKKKNRDDGILLTENPDDIFRMFSAIAPHIELSEVEDTVTHEIQHSDAARFLGAKTCYFGISIDEDGQGIRGAHKAFPLKTFRLGYASILARPEWLSDGDLGFIEKLNYSGGAQEVAERIAIWNDTNPDRQCLPPLSVS